MQTKPNAATEYSSPAGPFAMVMYNQLTSQPLKNGTTLNVTVLNASVQRAILPEIQRLGCSWVVQLWYHITEHSDTKMGDQYTLLFNLWNGETRKVVA